MVYVESDSTLQPLTDEDAPVNGPLLNAYDLSAGLGRSKFRKIYEDLRRCDTDCDVSATKHKEVGLIYS